MGLLAKPPTLLTNRGTAAGYDGQWQASRIVSTAWVDGQLSFTHCSPAKWCNPLTHFATWHNGQDCSTARLYCTRQNACPAQHAGQCRRQNTHCTWHPAQKLSRTTSFSTSLFSSGPHCCTPSGDCPTSYIPTLIRALI